MSDSLKQKLLVTIINNKGDIGPRFNTVAGHCSFTSTICKMLH
jgi:hypothetical protein